MTEKKLEIVAPPGKTHFTTRRVVDAPASLVWEAFTKPAYIARWMGPSRLTMTSCESDLRVGGSWRMVYRAPDGQEYAFHGVFRELERPVRIVRTFVFEAHPDEEAVETLRLDERDGKTTVHTETVHKTVAGRDGHLSGVEGMVEGFARLDALLAELSAR